MTKDWFTSKDKVELATKLVEEFAEVHQLNSVQARKVTSYMYGLLTKKVKDEQLGEQD